MMCTFICLPRGPNTPRRERAYRRRHSAADPPIVLPSHPKFSKRAVSTSSLCLSHPYKDPSPQQCSALPRIKLLGLLGPPLLVSLCPGCLGVLMLMASPLTQGSPSQGTVEEVRGLGKNTTTFNALSFPFVTNGQCKNAVCHPFENSGFW